MVYKEMDVYLLRHAETESNQAGRMSSCREDPLTQHGHFQAKSIVGTLLDLEVEAVLCSPYPRAVDTIKPFLAVSGAELHVSPCLAEGQLVLDMDIAHIAPVYEESASGYLCPVMNETAGAFLSRVRQAVELIQSQTAAKVLVVTHGHMIRELLNCLLRLPVKTRFPHSNCGLSHVSLSAVTSVGFINRELFANN